MFAAAEGVYEYGLPAVWPLTTPGVGVGEDIVKRTEFGTIDGKAEVENGRLRGGALY
jgi:hypothetical protein